MKRIIKLILGVAVLGGLTSCAHVAEMDSALLQSETLCLKIKDRLVFTFDEDFHQAGYNATLHQFRMGNDDMSEYVILNLSDAIVSGKTVNASMEWTENNSIQKHDGITFKAEKISEDGTVWLWSSSDRIAAVVKMLN